MAALGGVQDGGVGGDPLDLALAFGGERRVGDSGGSGHGKPGCDGAAPGAGPPRPLEGFYHSKRIPSRTRVGSPGICANVPRKQLRSSSQAGERKLSMVVVLKNSSMGMRL